eukprot:1150903-Pelagomonas_calceolata.AAC.6
MNSTHTLTFADVKGQQIRVHQGCGGLPPCCPHAHSQMSGKSKHHQTTSALSLLLTLKSTRFWATQATRVCPSSPQTDKRAAKASIHPLTFADLKGHQVLGHQAANICPQPSKKVHGACQAVGHRLHERKWNRKGIQQKG